MDGEQVQRLSSMALPSTDRGLSEPVSSSGEVRDPLANFVADLANRFDGLTLGVGKRPVDLLQAGHIRTSIAASHGDEEGGLSRLLFREELWLGARKIDAFLAHAWTTSG